MPLNHAASVRVVTAAEIDQHPAWHDCLAGQRMDRRFFEVIQATLTDGFEYHYFIVEDDAGGVVAIQPFFVVDQDLLAGTGRAVERLTLLVRRVFRRFMFARTLMVGCTAGEAHFDCATPQRAAWIVDALHGAIAKHASRIGASLIVFKEFPAQYRPSMTTLTNDGYTRVPSLPMTRLSLNYASFDEFLAKGLSKNGRHNVRRKLKAARSAPPLEMSVVEDASQWADEIYPLYLQVYERSTMQFQRLTKDCLAALGQRMPDKTRFFIWRQFGRVVAFGLCLVHADALYDEYVGMDYSVALDQHLYFLTLYAILAWAIEHGYRWYYSPSQGYDPKLHLGCELVPLDLYVTHRSRVVNFFLRRILPHLEPTHSEPALKKFRNYDALWSDA